MLRNVKKIAPYFLSLMVICVLLMTSFYAGSARAGAANTDITRSEEEQRTINIYKKANEAVVFITTKTFEVDPFGFIDELKPREGTGTGTIVDAAKGLLVTNLHVIQSVLQVGGTVEIMLASGQNSKAKLIGFDQESDLAVFQLLDPPANLAALPFGDSSKLEVGQRVLAIGNPFGLYRSLTTGIVSSLDRSMKTPNGAVLKDLIQTDAAINPGNSGGPLLDMEGRLVGINSAILSQSGDSAGIGFAVPINQIKRILPELVATGKVLRPRIGWQLVDTNQGPMVLRTIPGSPADDSGVQPIERPLSGVFMRGYKRDIDRADLIYKVDGKRVYTRDEVEDIVLQAKPPRAIPFTMRKGGSYGKEREIEVTPELR